MNKALRKAFNATLFVIDAGEGGAAVFTKKITAVDHSNTCFGKSLVAAVLRVLNAAPYVEGFILYPSLFPIGIYLAK